MPGRGVLERSCVLRPHGAPRRLRGRRMQPREQQVKVEHAAHRSERSSTSSRRSRRRQCTRLRATPESRIGKNVEAPDTAQQGHRRAPRTDSANRAERFGGIRGRQRLETVFAHRAVRERGRRRAEMADLFAESPAPAAPLRRRRASARVRGKMRPRTPPADDLFGQALRRAVA